MTEDDKSQMFRMQTLNDIEPGTILEVESFKMLTTSIGVTPCVKYAATLDGRRVKGRLIIPERFTSVCNDRIPCLVYYGGKKSIKGGKLCHHLQFISDDEGESDDNDSNSSDTL